jgi:hypothetical protein
MPLASSKTTSTRRPRLWSPWKASTLFSDQGVISVRQMRSWPSCLLVIDVAPNSHQCELIARLCHFAISGHTLVRNWSRVFAVTWPRKFPQVERAQHSICAMSAVLPMSLPELTAMRQGWNRVSGLRRWSRMVRRTSACQE